MEHRDPPPIISTEPRRRSLPRDDDPTTSAPLGLPAPDRIRRDPTRAARRVTILVGIVVCLGLTYLAGRAARSWLGEQPPYQLPFRAIDLDPPPPDWYRGGAARFLDEVRRRSNLPESIPLLKLDKTALKTAFKHNSPWIEDVPRIISWPFRITVRVVYRRPAALVAIQSTKSVYLIDGDAVLLPRDDLETDLNSFAQSQGLIEINGTGLVDPRDETPGHVWQPRPGVADLVPGNAKIPAAARLARFLIDRMSSIDRKCEPALSIRFINPMDPRGRGLFLKNAEDAYILWGEAPDEESEGSLKALEKWEKLKQWSREGKNEPIPDWDYWEIRPDGVHRASMKDPDAIPRPTSPTVRSGRPRKDRRAIPAKGTG